MNIVQERECYLIIHIDGADLSGPEKWEREKPEQRAVQPEENSQALHLLDLQGVIGFFRTTQAHVASLYTVGPSVCILAKLHELRPYRLLCSAKGKFCEEVKGKRTTVYNTATV